MVQLKLFALCRGLTAQVGMSWIMGNKYLCLLCSEYNIGNLKSVVYSEPN